ncbi:MAG: transporter related protein, partial [Actinomycetia bacterium]|nr:transporter related protein [Actinomycetes bacterium]
ILDSNTEELSYGRRQLVAIARALAANPSVVLLDEPAAGLSELERQELAALLRRMVKEHDVGVLLIEHDVNLVLDVSDRVTVLHFGEVLAAGTPDEVRSSPAVIEAYLGTASTERSDAEVVG